MKIRAILFVGAVAVVTLSFTFVGAKKPVTAKASNTTTVSSYEPVGGLYADVVE